MRRDKFFRIFWRSVKIVLACCLVSLWISDKSPFSEGDPEQGKPYRAEKVGLIWSEISDYVVYGDHLAVLYDSKGVVQLYSLDGEPQCTYEFSFGNNGRAELFTNGVNLIVEDRSHNCYLFSEQGVFLNYIIIDGRKNPSYFDMFLSKSEARTAKDGSVYERRGASIYKTSAAGESQKIVSRPFFMAIFQGPATGICLLICAVMLFVRSKMPKTIVVPAHEAMNEWDPRRENGVL